MGEIKRLQAENIERLQKLHDEHGVQVPVESMHQLRFNLEMKAIYDAVVSDEAKAGVDLKFEQIMSEQIDSIDKQIEERGAQERVKTLLHGVPKV